jgi:predicted LPLAT superfamily acyltransferase
VTVTARDPHTRPVDAHWSAHQERSNRLALKLMAWIAVNLGRRVARLVLHPITVYFLLFAPGPRRHIRRYLERALGRPPGWRDHYRLLHGFASVVLDRVYLARGVMAPFAFDIRGGDLVHALVAEGRGAFMVGAHIGSFEALHAVGKGEHLPVAMVMFPDNARMIHGVLQAIAPELSLEIIAIGRPGSTLAIRDWVDRGGLVGILGDRVLPGSGARSENVQIPFLGTPALFNDGPLRLAMLLKRKVIFMAGLYRGGNRYDVRFELMADFTQPDADPARREQQLRDALLDYVGRLEALCLEAPYNWFNFHDFWSDDDAA